MPGKQHLKNLGHLLGADRREVVCSILIQGVWKAVQGQLGYTESGSISLIVEEEGVIKEYGDMTRVGPIDLVHSS